MLLLCQTTTIVAQARPGTLRQPAHRQVKQLLLPPGTTFHRPIAPRVSSTIHYPQAPTDQIAQQAPAIAAAHQGRPHRPSSGRPPRRPGWHQAAAAASNSNSGSTPELIGHQPPTTWLTPTGFHHPTRPGQLLLQLQAIFNFIIGSTPAAAASIAQIAAQVSQQTTLCAVAAGCCCFFAATTRFGARSTGAAALLEFQFGQDPPARAPANRRRWLRRSAQALRAAGQAFPRVASRQQAARPAAHRRQLLPAAAALQAAARRHRRLPDAAAIYPSSAQVVDIIQIMPPGSRRHRHHRRRPIAHPTIATIIAARQAFAIQHRRAILSPARLHSTTINNKTSTSHQALTIYLGIVRNHHQSRRRHRRINWHRIAHWHCWRHYHCSRPIFRLFITGPSPTHHIHAAPYHHRPPSSHHSGRHFRPSRRWPATGIPAHYHNHSLHSDSPSPPGI